MQRVLVPCAFDLWASAQKGVCVPLYFCVPGTVGLYLYENLSACMMALSEWGPVHFSRCDCVCCSWDACLHVCVSGFP